MSLGNTGGGAAKVGQSSKRRDEEMSDSDASSPREMRRCFCGSMIKDGEGIYCSAGTSLFTSSMTSNPLETVKQSINSKTVADLVV